MKILIIYNFRFLVELEFLEYIGFLEYIKYENIVCSINKIYYL